MSQHFNRIAICLSAFAAVALTSVGHAETDEAGVAVLRSDESSLVVEFRPQFLEPRAIVGQGNQFTLYDFKGSVANHGPQAAGAPDIRRKELPIGFRNREGNVITVIEADYEDIPNIRFAPVPRYRVKNDMVELSSYTPDEAKYGLNALLPAGTAELGPIGKSRTMLLGSIYAYPLRYNPATRTLRKYSRIVVQVSFSAATEVRLRNDDDQMLADGLLNANVARHWKFGQQSNLSKITARNSVLSSGRWYRMPITEDGIYRLDAQFLQAAGISLSTIDPRTIKIYGNGGQMLSENVDALRPQDLVENAIYVEGEADGQFNPGDYVVFYAQGVRGVKYDAAYRTLRHYIHLYSEENYCWFTYGGTAGKRMTQQPSLTETPTVVPAKFQDMAFVEEERVNVISSGKEWLGRPLLTDEAFTFIAPLPGLIPGDTLLYRYSFAWRSQSYSTFIARQGSIVIQTDNLPAGGDPSDLGSYVSTATVEVRSPASLVQGGTSRQSFTYSSQGTSATGWVDWAEIVYPRSFDAVNNYLRFRSPDVSGVVEYRLNGFSATPMLFDVTRPDSVTRIIATGTTFRAGSRGGGVSEFCAALPGSFKTPASMAAMPNQDLRGTTDSIAFIILTTPELKPAALRLAAHRERADRGNLRTRVVELKDIYNEFSGGVPDVAAIRDFLKYAYENWTPDPATRHLKYVLFFGACSYDFKGILGSTSSFVPNWQGGSPYDGIYSIGSDDFFAQFDSRSLVVSLTTGRLSVRQLGEANQLVDKIIRYDENSTQDSWKTRILYVGDDGWTTDGIEYPPDQHTQAEEILAEVCTPKLFERQKVYIAEYPTVNNAQGRRKPGAYQDIIDAINRGVLITNFTGHGNPVVWAHENVFNVQTTIPQMVNANKLSLFFAATCDFSHYDDAKRATGSELLLNKPDGGAIAVISASRKVFGGENNSLHQDVTRKMFLTDGFGRPIVERPAVALFRRKSQGNDYNSLKFHFLGDPTMRLQFPSGFASIDSINRQPVDTIGGNPRTTAIQLRSLERVTVKGQVRDQANRTDTTYNGRMSLVVNDANRVATIVDFVPGLNWAYLASGSLIFRGENTVANGRFAATFIVPKDIGFADSLATGRMLAHVYNQSADAVGYTTKIRLAGSDTTVVRDTAGPSINIYLDSRGFKTGDMASESPMLIVDLVDSSGINTSVSGIGHRIEAWVNNSPQSKDLTDSYSSKLDNYQAGTVQYQLRDLPQGMNAVRVRAWDTFNNAKVAETRFAVTSTDRLRISDVFNYPNPFPANTDFTFRQNQIVPLNVSVKIYTLAGRLIRTIDAVAPGDPFVRIPWDGRDRDGDKVANGVYLYKILARTVDGRFSSEVINKLAVAK